MINLSKLPILRNAFLATSLVAAASIPATCAYAVTKASAHGVWMGFIPNADGEIGFSVLAPAPDGATAGLMVQGEKIAFALTSPDWRTAVGKTMPVEIVIDGVPFNEQARFVKKGVAIIDGITNDIVVRLSKGHNATLAIGRGGPSWTFGLDGFGETLADTVKAYVKS